MTYKNLFDDLQLILDSSTIVRTERGEVHYPDYSFNKVSRAYFSDPPFDADTSVAVLGFSVVFFLSLLSGAFQVS